MPLSERVVASYRNYLLQSIDVMYQCKYAPGPEMPGSSWNNFYRPPYPRTFFASSSQGIDGLYTADVALASLKSYINNSTFKAQLDSSYDAGRWKPNEIWKYQLCVDQVYDDPNYSCYFTIAKYGGTLLNQGLPHFLDTRQRVKHQHRIIDTQGSLVYNSQLPDVEIHPIYLNDFMQNVTPFYLPRRATT